MSTTSNSASPILSQYIENLNNNLELLSGITQSTESNLEYINVTINNSVYSIPSFGYLKNEISRINKNIEILSGWNGQGEVSLKNYDGTYKTIYSIDETLQPNKIELSSSPKNFNSNINWFFESFLNPLLSINLNVTNIVDNNTSSFKVKRIIIENTVESISWFDNYIGQSSISFISIVNEMIKNNINYSIDENTINLNPIEIPVWGYFDVLNWIDDSTSRKYVLNSITYNDINGNKLNLNVGDILLSGKNTKWEITNVDSSNNSISLSKISGWEYVNIGSSTLKLLSKSAGNKSIDINIGINERQFIFLKSINKSNIISNEWSSGFAIYSNNLIDSNSNETLENYYKKYVTDYGQFFLSISKERPISAVNGLEPNAPILSSSNFNVVKINDHKYSKDEEESILNKSKQRYSLDSELSQLTQLIQNKKDELGTKNYSGNERNKLKNELNSLLNEKKLKSSQYNSLSKELITIGKNSSITEKGKYRIRGFWGMPDARIDKNNINQEIIQFLISYRYLRKDKSSQGAKEYEFIDSKGEKAFGYYSEWNEYKSDIRKKEYDIKSGIYIWQTENPSIADIININQLDIPISPNESVEIKIKSISEAGWPVNPLYSKWSESVIIEFPESLNIENTWDSSIQSALDDENRIKFNEELNEKGLDLHLNDSYIQGEKYWAHDSSSISSGFTENGIIISLYDKLNKLDLEINKLKELINRAKGTLQIRIIDSNGNKISVSNNTKIDLFAGYYKDEISSLPSDQQKGAIINKIFYIGISNSSASTLELISRFPGGSDELLPESISLPLTDPYQKYQYDLVPIGISGYLDNVNALDNKSHPLPYQSSQNVSQWIYFRKKNIGLKNDIYSTPPPSTDFWLEPDTPTYLSSGPNFVWDGTSSSTNGTLTEFCIHTSHPKAQLGLSFNDLQDPYISGQNPIKYPEFRHSYFFNLDSSETNGNIQLQYMKPDLLSARGKYAAKIGFSDNDRYLIGKKTCGCYLYPAISNTNLIKVNGNDNLALMKIEFGDENEIKIPIAFQYRMMDYFGSSTSINEGKIGGWNSSNIYPQNLTYRKKIGVDIQSIDESIFSFDLEISSKFKKDSISELTTNPLQIANIGTTQFNLTP